MLCRAANVDFARWFSQTLRIFHKNLIISRGGGICISLPGTGPLKTNEGLFLEICKNDFQIILFSLNIARWFSQAAHGSEALPMLGVRSLIFCLKDFD